MRGEDCYEMLNILGLIFIISLCTHATSMPSSPSYAFCIISYRKGMEDSETTTEILIQIPFHENLERNPFSQSSLRFEEQLPKDENPVLKKSPFALV